MVKRQKAACAARRSRLKPSRDFLRSVVYDLKSKNRSAPKALLREELTMKRILIALAATTVLASPAFATKIGVSMDKFDDNFLTVLRNSMSDYAKTQPGVTLQIEDAKDDVSKQISQVQNFIANGVDAIIVNPVDTSATAGHHQGRRRRPACRSSMSTASRPTSKSWVRRPPSSLRTRRSPEPRDAADLQAARRQGRYSRHRGPALQPGRGAAHQGHP